MEVFKIFFSEVLKFIFKNKESKFKITETSLLIENTSLEFKNTFFTRNNEELIFRNRTGIETDYNMIPKYVKLKDELGHKFNWECISKSLEYLDFDETKDRFEVRIKDWDEKELKSSDSFDKWFLYILAGTLICFLIFSCFSLWKYDASIIIMLILSLLLLIIYPMGKIQFRLAHKIRNPIRIREQLRKIRE